MPSLRKPLSIKQKLIALYTDPNTYLLADRVARMNGAAYGHGDYRRHVTCFLLDVEARVHTNRQETQRNATGDRDLWNLRRSWALQATGRDVLLPRSPSADDVRKWRERWIHPDTWFDVDYRHLPLPPKEARAEAERLAHAENNVRAFVAEYERLAMNRARELGQFPSKKRRNLAKLKPRYMCSADGTYLRGHSLVDSGPDPETEEIGFTGNRNRDAKIVNGKVKHTRVQKSVHREGKNGRDTMGVNHVAILTRTEFGRVILGVERATGGEVHAALKVMDRIAPLAEGAIRGLAYDKALTGWQIDYLLANHGIVSVAPPIAAKGKLPEEREAAEVADRVLAARDEAIRITAEAEAASQPAAQKGKKKRKKANQGTMQRHRTTMKAAVATRVLGKIFDVDRLGDDVEDGRASGAGLALGTSVYLNSHSEVVPVKSQHQKFLIRRHDAGGEQCAHELYVDDGALWDTRLERGRLVKDQRLVPVYAETRISKHTGWLELWSMYEFVCEYTGEVLTEEVSHAPDGAWYAEEENTPRRTARHAMMLLARCDPGWRKIYGLRNDCESWFAWLKMQMLEDKRAASLDLNHQLLDVLYAGLITNAITRFNHRRERAF